MQPVSSRNKLILKIIVIILAVTFSIIAALIVITITMGDKAKQLVVDEINSHLLVKVEVGDVDFTIFRSFPDASVVFHNIATSPATDQPEMPGLIHAGTVSLRFGIFSLLTNQYKIHSVLISDAAISLWKDEKGKNNYEIWKSTSASNGNSVNFKINAIRFRRVELYYRDLYSETDVALILPDISLKGSKNGGIYDLTLKGRLQANRLMFQQNDYSLSEEASLDLNLNINQPETSITLGKSQLSIAGTPIEIEGTIGTGGPLYPVDLLISTNHAEISNIIKMLPPRFTEAYREFEPGGLLDAEIQLKGLAGKDKLPTINAKFNLQKGTIVHVQSKTTINSLSAEGTFTKDAGILYKLNLQHFEGSTGKGEFKGKGSLVDFNNPMISLNLSTKLDLSELNGFLENDQIKNLEGNLVADINYEGSASKGVNIVSKANGTLLINDLRFTHIASGRDISDLNAQLELGNGFVYVNGLSLKSGNTDLNIKGKFQNLLEHLFFKDQPLYFDAEIKSEKLDLEDLVSFSTSTQGSSSGNSTGPFQKDLSFDVRLNIDQLNYRKFSASEATGTLNLKDQVLKAENLQFKAMDGRITANGLMNSRYENQYSVICNADFRNVDIERLFYEFGDFGQTSLRSSHLRGHADAQVQFGAMLDSSFEVDANSVNAVGDVEIRNGELLNFEPLQELSRFLDASELKNVKFSTMKNRIEIVRQTVIIPEMEVKSSVMNLKGYGAHSFGNDIDYHFNVLLSEIGRKKRRNQPPAGAYEEDDSGRTRLFLHMTGTVDEPEFRYDSQAVVRKIADDFKNQKQELRQVLRREFGKNKEALPEKTAPQVKFEVEWEEK
ncbi:MAG: AsmA-like C-terminal region-containing protein [Lentimicrobium sp.]|nr:AsmA-like C-terminal region-containing protein [Lentimicrobium sp.]